MKRLAFLSLLLLSSKTFAAACCLGGNPMSFISLSRLQQFELGLSTTARDVYGRYDIYGDKEAADRNRTLTLALGAGARVSEDWQAFAIVPFVHQQTGNSRTALGDVLIGAQYLLLESLFLDEWYPTIAVSAGVKAPTGALETTSEGKKLPGTGNGIWEPFLGLTVQKHFGDFTLTARGSYSARFARGDFKEGDLFEASEALMYAWDARFSTSLGLGQSWVLNQRRNGQVLDDTHMRVFNGFGSATYFVDRFWSVALGVDATLPIARLGVNQNMTQSVSFTTRYAFY